MRIPSMSSEKRWNPITPDDKSTAIRITTWATLGVLIIMFLARQTIKYSVVRKAGIDDLCILFATIFAIGLSVTNLILAADGLGRSEILTNKRANALMKAYYASDFLYILALCFAKLTLITFFCSIVVQRKERRIIQGFGIFITAWSLASLVAVAFQCGLPRPWEVMTLHCYNRGVFWIIYCIIDMTSEVGLVMLSVNLVAYLKVKFSRKVIVVACFAPRILVIAAALARLIYFFPITPHDNPEFNLWVPVICTQIQVCLSISTACVPYVKCIFEGIEDSRKRRTASRSWQAIGSNSGYYEKGHKKGKEAWSFDSAATLGLKYGRTPDASPRIPSPPPLSPLTPPRLGSPFSSNRNSRSPSERGLKLHIPPPQARTTTTDVISPQTASPHVLSSPEIWSANGLLSPPPFSRSFKQPDASPRPHTSRPRRPSCAHQECSHGSQPVSGSNCPDHSVSPVRQQPKYTVFPRGPTAQYSLIPQIAPTPPPTIPRTRLGRSPQRVSIHRMQPNTAKNINMDPPLPPLQHPPRTSSRPSNEMQPKFSTGPDPGQRISTATVSSHGTSRRQTQSGVPTIPSYYLNTPPETSPPTFPLPQPPINPHRTSRNQRILTPQNSSRKDQMSPVSPSTPGAPPLFSRDGSINEHGKMRANRPWDFYSDEPAEPMPVVQKMNNRGSPRLIIKRPE
ncbi:hypothetical protein BU24DRAFT_401550 [Aaosphaeria arxii CBS 175.79]|uniref:Rhodopsin domain-containing protein n=1 Tax=Aaosphaeria arxii CBS 175.79 TaxID=1450172 RepID=A0A6A5X9K2_9PLEO|nr:uncharacterized protein BU24DRAFT_401550 [Aaosphaeria arxii CBS 175.79]KAF2009648.1 hypothetical protein BU24DRAFT_401550 [Aaosphaeria arxii CBS 175.79]